MKRIMAFVLVLALFVGALGSSLIGIFTTLKKTQRETLEETPVSAELTELNAETDQMELEQINEILTNPPAPTTTARGMCTLDAETGRVLFARNEHEKLPMASTTKIVTAITVLDNCFDLDTPFTVDPRAIGIHGTSIYLKPNEQLTARELLYGLMLRSGNDASVALALHISRDIQTFANLMNETAIRAGALNSSFKNPHGLDADGHYTTAYDLSLITAYAMKNPIFREIVSTRDKKISGVDYPRILHNKNRLLASMDNCVGVKTGFTKKAGRCYVGAITENDTTIICTVLNCGPMFEESAELMTAGMDIMLDESAQNAWYMTKPIVQ